MRCPPLAFAAVILLGGFIGLSAQDPEAQLLRGLWLETVEGDLEGAIAEYERIFTLDAFSTEIAARAHLRIGICRRLRGEHQAAEIHFRSVAELYPQEVDAARLARRYLGGRPPSDPALFLPGDALVAIEVVDPPAIVALLESSLRGSPLEDPIRAGNDAAAENAWTGALPERARFAAALLNQAFLREIEKIERVAFVLAPAPDGQIDGIGVLAPGRSDVLRGIFHASVSVVGAERHDGFWVYSPNPEELHIAVGDDVIVWSDSRSSLLDALLRQRDGNPSLATRESWQRTVSTGGRGAARILIEEGWAAALERVVKEDSRPVYELLAHGFGLASVHPIHLEVSTEGAADRVALHLEARAPPDALPALWSAVRTPDRAPGLERFLPASTVAWAALRVDRPLERLDELAAGLEALRERYPAVAPLAERVGAVAATLDHGPGRSLVEAIDEAIVAVHGTDDFPSLASVVLAVAFRPEVDGDALLRETIPAIVQALIPSAAEPPPLIEEEQKLRSGLGPVTWFEPLPGSRVGWARAGPGWILGLDWNVLGPLLEETGEGPPAAPSSASKVAWLGPARLLEAARRRSVSETAWSRVIARWSGVVLETKEGPGRLDMTLSVTEAASVLRALWSEWARRESEESEPTDPGR